MFICNSSNWICTIQAGKCTAGQIFFTLLIVLDNNVMYSMQYLLAMLMTMAMAMAMPMAMPMAMAMPMTMTM